MAASERTSSAAGRYVGVSRRRVEDERLLTGRGCFVADVRVPRCLHLCFARSHVAHGRVTRCRVDDAGAAPGVVAVITGHDLRHVEGPGVNPVMAAIHAPRFPVLAVRHVMAVGEPVAAVVAETAEAARDAAERVQLEVEPLEPVLDPQGEGPRLFAAIAGNESIAGRWQAGDIEAAFSRADVVAHADIEYARIAPAPLEPRACLAVPDESSGVMTVWLSTQTPHRARADLASALGIEDSAVHVIAPDVGGAFGMKASLYPEELAVAWAARELGRPVRWVATRSEEMLSATQGRGARLRGELALTRQGTMLGLRARVLFPLGHWLPFSAAVPAWNAGRIPPGPYLVDAVDIASRAVLTSTAAVGIYRGAGRPEAAMLLERLVDDAARRLAMDPADLRRRNFVPAERFPYPTPTGQLLDSGDYGATFEAACDAADYPALRETQERRRVNGELVGVGLAFYLEPSGRGFESARLQLRPDGSILLASGSSAQGQGRETAYAQVVADALQVPVERIEVIYGDTARCPKGIGALASRSTPIGGGAIVQAARELVDHAQPIAARLLQCERSDLEQAGGGFRVRGDAGRCVSWEQVAGAAVSGRPRAKAVLEAGVSYEAPGEAWGCGCCVALVSIDAETGSLSVEGITWVDDAGNVVNPMLVEGQILGGIAQGIGEALMERVTYDEAGQLTSGTFMDYALPRAADVPPVVLSRTVSPSPHNLLGAKGVGEAGSIATPAAVLNAAMDALAPLGVGNLALPLTPERIWRAIRDAAREE